MKKLATLEPAAMNAADGVGAPAWLRACDPGEGRGTLFAAPAHFLGPESFDVYSDRSEPTGHK